MAPGDKAQARTIAIDYLVDDPADGVRHALRINGLDTRAGISDLDALLGSTAAPDFLVLPKMETVAFLCLCRRDVSDRREDPAVVEPFDPFERGELHGLITSPGAAPPDDLGFIKAVDRLGERIVVRVADAAHRRLDAGLGETISIFDRDVLRAASAPCSRSWPRSHRSSPTARHARLDAPKPSAPHGREPQMNKGGSLRHGSTLSRIGASGNPGAVHPGEFRAREWDERDCAEARLLISEPASSRIMLSWTSSSTRLSIVASVVRLPVSIGRLSL